MLNRYVVPDGDTMPSTGCAGFAELLEGSMWREAEEAAGEETVTGGSPNALE